MPSLPDVPALAVGSQWRVEDASPTVEMGMRYRQWLLRDATGNEASLFVGATTKTQVMLRWSGELGYQGEGYVVTDRGEQALPLSDRHTVTITRAEVRHLSDRLLLQYAIVAPGGVVARGTQSAWRALWDALRGTSGPYYVVRVAGMPGGGVARVTRERDRLLATVLSALLARVDTGSATG